MQREPIGRWTWVVLGALAVAGCAECFAPARAPTPAPLARRQAAVPPAAPTLSVVDRARAEQDRHCGQRHVESEQGVLKETAEEKLDRDARCVELRKRDYIR